MGLGLNVGGGEGGGSGDRIPFLKYNAKAGRLYKVDRAQGIDGMWASSESELSPGFSAVWDLANIEVGWIHYTKDRGPVKIMVPLGSPIGPRPVETVLNDEGKQRPAYKTGFNVLLALSKDNGGGLRELNANAGCVVDAVSELHDAYMAGLVTNPGKLPVVRFAAVKKEKAGQSENFKPVLEIVSWVERPPILNVAPKPAAPVSVGTPPSTGSTVVAPPRAPAPAPVPQPELADASDFG